MKIKAVKIIFFCVPGFLVLLALLILDLYIHNFHTVIPNEVYRSRQLSKAQFNEVIRAYHIKSILNLRGAQPQLVWYQKELAISHRLHVHHYDLALRSKQLPSPHQLKKLLTILITAPRPLLIHCQSGVDRSGFAAMLALLLAHKPLSIAKEQVSWKYFVLSDASVGRQFLRR